MSERWVVVCHIYGWESVPLSRADAEDLLEDPTLLHPFESSCRDTHAIERAGG